MARSPQPTKPLDCFTEEQKLWAVEQLKTELPDAWQRLVRQQAHNMELYSPSSDERAEWARDSVLAKDLIRSFPFDYGDDGWELNRQGVLFGEYVDAAVAEAKRLFNPVGKK